MSQMIKGYWISQIVGTLATLGIPDLLAEHALTFDELAKESNVSRGPRIAYFAHRHPSASCRHRPGGLFDLTPLGADIAIERGRLDARHGYCADGSRHWLPWGRLADAIRRGERQTPSTLVRELFQYYAENPDREPRLYRRECRTVLLWSPRKSPVCSTHRRPEHIVDVGGGSGTIMAALLDRNPRLRGTILELAYVVPRARTLLAEQGLSSRCEVVEGDFFKAVPEADIHISQTHHSRLDDEAERSNPFQLRTGTKKKWDRSSFSNGCCRKTNS